MNEETLSKLERLAKLRDQGAITQAEFDQQKASLLGTPPPLPTAIPQPVIPADEPGPDPEPVSNPLFLASPDAHEEELPKSNFWQWVLGTIAVLIVLTMMFTQEKKPKSDSGTYTDSSSTMSTDTSIETSATPAVPPKPESKWSYFDDTDKMGRKWWAASVDANELLQFSFPYNGGSTATFTIRRKGGSTDVFLRVDKGQFITPAGDGGSAVFRFDQGRPVTFSTSGPADYSSDIVFFGNERALISRIKKAKKMVIEIEFYSEGSQQIEFNVSSLKWNH